MYLKVNNLKIDRHLYQLISTFIYTRYLYIYTGV